MEHNDGVSVHFGRIILVLIHDIYGELVDGEGFAVPEFQVGLFRGFKEERARGTPTLVKLREVVEDLGHRAFPEVLALLREGGTANEDGVFRG